MKFKIELGQCWAAVSQRAPQRDRCYQNKRPFSRLAKNVPVAAFDGLTISEMIVFGSSSCYRIGDNCHCCLDLWGPKFVQLNRTSSVSSLK